MANDKKIKYITTHMIVVLMIGGLIYGSIVNVSLNQVGAVAYAADDWQDLDDGDLLSAFQAYCKSRNLLIEGSAAYAATTWTTATFNNICASLGIDVTELQASLKKKSDGNIGTKWLFSVTGVTGFNRICAELLQNNDIDVGEQNLDKQVYSGKSINIDGHNYLIYVIDTDGAINGGGTNRWGEATHVLQWGSPFLYSREYLLSCGSGTQLDMYFTVTSSSLKWYVLYNSYVGSNYINNSSNEIDYTAKHMPLTVSGELSGRSVVGNFALCYSTVNENYYLNCFYHNLTQNKVYAYGTKVNIPVDNPADDTNIRIVTPTDKPVLPALPEDEPIEIGDDGDTGGDGGDNPSDPDDWEPTTPTIPEPSSPDFPSVEIPDIDIPDLPSLNFSLGDLSEKFPFSIPFDLIALLSVLDGEPKAPHIQATIPIGTYYTWEFDADFSEFDNYARIFRAFEFIGFCIALIWLTIHFTKG